MRLFTLTLNISLADNGYHSQITGQNLNIKTEIKFKNVKNN